MAQRLTDMEINEISLVDEPANDAARVVIVKAKGGFKPCDDCKTPGECMKKGACAAVAKSDDEDEDDMEGDYDAPPGKKVPMAKIAGAVIAAIEELAPQIVEKAMAEGFSADPDAAASAAAIIKETVMDMEAVTKALEDAEAKLDALEKRTADAEAAVKDRDEVIKAKDAEIAELAKSKATPADEEAEILKSLPESIRKRLEDAEAAKVAAEAEVQKRKDDAEKAEAIAKAKSLNVGNPEAVGDLLLRVRKGLTTQDDAATLEALLKSAGEIAAKSPLFKSIGSAASTEGDPEALLKAKAEEIVEKSGGKTSFAQAYDQALAENPALYNDYVAKRRA